MDTAPNPIGQSNMGGNANVFITGRMLCERWKISMANLRRAVRSGRCPPPRRIVGGRRVVWAMADILAHESGLPQWKS